MTRPPRLPRFTLRTLLFLVLLFCIAFGWLGSEINQARDRKDAVETIQKLGGKVFYKHQIDQWEKPAGPQWLRHLLGAHFFDRVVHIEFDQPGVFKEHVTDLSFVKPMDELRELFLDDTAVNDISVLADKHDLRVLSLMRTRVENITALANLTNLKVLYLNRLPVDDLSPLTHLKLERIGLRGSQVSDISPLDMERLVALDLYKTRVKDVSPLAAAQNLQQLNLNWTNVSNLQPLHGLKNLQKLDIGRTKVSPEEVARLKNALPQCVIQGP